MAVLSLLLNSATAQTPEFWGMTYGGGSPSNYYGIIFKTDTNGLNQSVEFDFNPTPGAFPKYTKLCQASNGKLYGMTTTGDSYNAGGIFEYDPVTNHSVSVHQFSNQAFKGYEAYGSLIEATNGKLYGMTHRGGVNNKGIIFEFDPNTKIYTKKIDFDGSNGNYPSGGFVQASNGKLYGQTSNGLIEYNISTNTCIKKVNGTGGEGDLIQATNGRLYGIIGHYIFEYIAGRDSLNRTLYFADTDIGDAYAFGSLVQASNGKLYGMTFNGGTNGKGTLFEYNTNSNTANKKMDFNGSVNGENPHGSLIQASNGKLYGMTSSGGINSKGVLFEFDYNTNIYNKKLDFDGTNKGAEPHGTLMQASNGKLYGLTSKGGKVDWGVILEYNITSSSFVRKLNFHFNDYGNSPYGSLMQASNGKLYGMSWDEGINRGGVLFEIDPTTSLVTVKWNFEYVNGNHPYGSLTEASNGKLYGMNSQGGGYYGVLFEFDLATGIYTKKIDFVGSNGGQPRGSLTEASNGKLYGMTENYGSNSRGVLFEYTPSNNILTVVFNFADAIGTYPSGSLIQASNGKLYGMTYSGGTNSKGVLFEFDPATNTYAKKVDFDITNGASPYGSLTETSNGKLYGMTSSGGTNNEGVLFEYDIATNILTKKLDFDDVDKGKTPKGSLMQASNGKLYGMTYAGGVNDMGVMFEYDIDSDTYTKTLDFDGANGKEPMYGHLIELTDTPPANTTVQNVTLNNGESECYNATNTITVAGEGTTVVVSSGGEATFIAGGKILFKPGFSSLSGSYTSAQITTTNNYCNVQQNMAAAQNNNSPETANETVTFDELINDNIKLNIYPNPTSGNFTVSFSDKAASAEIALYSLQGNMLYKVSCKETLKQEIDISHFETGMYIIIIKTGKKVITGKVIKNN